MVTNLPWNNFEDLDIGKFRTNSRPDSHLALVIENHKLLTNFHEKL